VAKILELSGMIHSKYGSEVNMADAMHWSRQRLNKITNCKKVPNLYEVLELANALGTDYMTMAHIFLSQKYTIVDKNDDPLAFGM